MNIAFRKIFGAFAMLLLLAVFGSCRDDLVLEEGGSASWGEDGQGGIVIGIGNTRGGFTEDHTSMISEDPEETVINENNFHVVLFDAKGAVVEDWENQEISKITEPSPEFGGMKRTKYFVRIPRKKIQDSTIELMRREPFKIAVFANWADYPKFTRDKNETTDENGINRNNLFFISHSHEDTSYENNSGVDGETTDSEVFGFITGAGSKMGVAQEWVANRFQDDEEADAAIRRKYQINEDGTGKFVSNEPVILTNSRGMSSKFNMDEYTYNDVWQVWNFGGEKNYDENDKETFYKSSVAANRIKWAKVNNDWYEKCFNASSGSNQKVDDGTTVRGLTVYHPEYSSVQGRQQTINGKTYYPIELKHYSRGTGIQEIKVSDGSYLHFKLPADGYMYIKCQALTEGAKLVARRGALNVTDKNLIKQKEFTPATDNIDVITLDYKDAGNQMIRVTGEPEEFVLYALGGTIEIYEIDYIKSRMIQIVDRQMINPFATPEGGISMYGIQDFEPAGLDVWPEGTTFNLSRFETTHTGKDAPSYKYRTISLLRSVSKVEVYVPKSIFPKPSHMYLRTINRFSRSAPIDIFTPTNIIWDGWKEGNGYNDGIVEGWNMGMTGSLQHHYEIAPGIDAEAENIRKYGFTYKKYGNTFEGDKSAEYRDAVSWLFGLWEKEFGWNWGGESITIDPSKPRPYPRVFNTRIARSDYAHMLYGGEKDGCYYYYAYLPEKNITDPNNKGTLDDSPKVMRVEMRFGDRNTDVNLDDNASYRIYFMPGGKGAGVTDRDSYDGVLETGSDNDESVQMQNLRKMYPIMRNHLYRFKITGIDMNGLNVNFEVKGAETRDINYTFD